jgi:hypothetical protein
MNQPGGLPPFERRPYVRVKAYISAALTNRHRAEESFLRALIVHDDGSYEAHFDPDYFGPPRE